MKNQKGITLIALVITIIVMLILVGVTVTVSLNGGLFSTAKEATDETQTAKESEELLMAAMGALGENGKVDLDKLDNNLPEGFTGSNWQYTSKTGNVFKVSENGSITLVGEGSGEQPETPVVPPASPTITITPERITGEIESGTTEEIGTITVTATNVDGDLTWSITPTDSGLELVDTDNANVKKVIASKAVENATITVSYGDVSDTSTLTITEKKQEYKLSGTWVFNDTLTELTTGTYNISFECNGQDNKYFEFSTSSGMYDEILCFTYGGSTNGYDDNYQYYFGEDPWVTGNASIGWQNDVYKTVNFGSEPQEVSQEFYEWFTANAIQVTQISFTIDGTTYTVAEGTTWNDWISKGLAPSNIACMETTGFVYDKNTGLSLRDSSSNEVSVTRLITSQSYSWSGFVSQ